MTTVLEAPRASRGGLAKGDMQDKVRLMLLEYGQNEVYISVDTLASKTHLSHYQVYQTLYRLKQLNEIDLIKEDESNPRSAIIGIKLLKMERPEAIVERTVEKKVENFTLEPTLLDKIPNTIVYIQQKIAVENARKELLRANVDPDSIKFDIDPLGEEALVLLDRLTNTAKQLITTKDDLAAARRDVLFLKGERQGQDA